MKQSIINLGLVIAICFALCLFIFYPLRVIEGDYYGKSPSYSAYKRNKQIGLIAKSRFFWVRNYRGDKSRNKLNQIALKLICESLQDTVNVAELTLEFATGASQWDIGSVADFVWDQNKPNEVVKYDSDAANLDEYIQVFKLDCTKSGGVKK